MRNIRSIDNSDPYVPRLVRGTKFDLALCNKIVEEIRSLDPADKPRDVGFLEINCQLTPNPSVFKNSVKGFTLIEVLLALAILAISLTALLKATAETIHNTNRIKEKSIQHWVGMQAIASVQLNITPLKLNQSTTQYTEMLGQAWYWRAKLIPTPIKTMQQINVTVSQHKTGPFTDLLVAFKHEE